MERGATIVKNTLWEVFSVVFLTSAATSVGLYFIYHLMVPISLQDRKDNIVACKSLNPKFTDVFTVYSGFYEGQIFVVTSVVDKEKLRGVIRVQQMFGNWVTAAENVEIECSLLKKEER